MSAVQIETWLCPDCQRITCECPGLPRDDRRCVVCGVHHDAEQRKKAHQEAVARRRGEGAKVGWEIRRAKQRRRAENLEQETFEPGEELPA